MEITRKQFDDAVLEEAVRSAEDSMVQGLSTERSRALMALLIMHGELISRKLFGQRTPDDL
jgi:hypothetical protein